MKAWRSIPAASLILALASAAGVALAQDKWPSKPIRMIVPFTSGSASDVLGRIVAQRLTEIYGQQLVIDNRPGAGGLIGSELTRQAAPDGYTITMVGQPHLSNALLRKDKPYDPLKDFAAISLAVFRAPKTLSSKRSSPEILRSIPSGISSTGLASLRMAWLFLKLFL